MKKLLITAVAVLLAGGVMAANLEFDAGINFFQPALAGAQAKEGQTLAMSWGLDTDLMAGIYTELTNLVGGAGVAAGDTLAVTAIQVSKGVVKNVVVGLNLGRGTPSSAGAVAANLADVFGTVTILSGSGEKITGSLKAMVAARYCNSTPKMDGYNFGLAVGVGF
jgi:hypothetical protein